MPLWKKDRKAAVFTLTVSVLATLLSTAAALGMPVSFYGIYERLFLK